jgi:hypothetical protein
MFFVPPAVVRLKTYAVPFFFCYKYATWNVIVVKTAKAFCALRAVLVKKDG